MEDNVLTSDEYVTSKLIRQREAELLKKVRKARLLADIEVEKPGFRERILSRSGEILILVGQKLKGRYEPGFDTQLALKRQRAIDA
jgi:hypothetical protein